MTGKPKFPQAFYPLTSNAALPLASTIRAHMPIHCYLSHFRLDLTHGALRLYLVALVRQ